MHVVSLTIAFTNPSKGVITTHNTGELQNIQVAYRLNGKNYLNGHNLFVPFWRETEK